jgi:hypothetical protein
VYDEITILKDGLHVAYIVDLQYLVRFVPVGCKSVIDFALKVFERLGHAIGLGKCLVLVAKGICQQAKNENAESLNNGHGFGMDCLTLLLVAKRGNIQTKISQNSEYYCQTVQTHEFEA